MEFDNVGEVIATREFELSGSTGKITVRLGKPEPFPDGDDYCCRYQIIGLAGNRVRYAVGVDGMQALIPCLQQYRCALVQLDGAQRRSTNLAW